MKVSPRLFAQAGDGGRSEGQTDVTEHNYVNGAKYRDAPPRVLARILAAPYETNAQGCRLWTGETSHDGYGETRYRVGDKRPHVYVHRLVYVALIGDPGDNAQVDHLCHDPAVCVVPPDECPHRRCYDRDHLRAATGAENVLRSGALAAANKVKTRCKRGHRFNAKNTYWTRSGTRYCRECNRLRMAAKRAELRAAGAAA